jgi:hypothetical protein
VTPSDAIISAAGGIVAVTVQTTSQCGWNVVGLPLWITLPANLVENGTVTFNLAVAPNTDAARIGSVMVGGQFVTIHQGAPCTGTLGQAGQGFPAGGGSGAIAIVAASDCVWSLPVPPAWVTYSGATSGTGNGSAPFQVAANTGVRRGATLTVDGVAFAIDQNGATPSQAGTLAHFATGDGWVTQFTLVNTGYGSSGVQLNFFDDNGNAIGPTAMRRDTRRGAQPRALDAASAPTLSDTLSSGAVLKAAAPTTIESGSTESSGWAEILTDGTVNGYGVFQLNTSTGTQEAVVPPETRNASVYYVPFDNTGGYYYGVALSNTTTAQVDVAVTIRDAATGNVTATDTISLPSSGHAAFVLTERYPGTANAAGTLQFASPNAGELTVLGLRFNPNHAFTSVPPLVLSTVPAGQGLQVAGAMAHVAAGGGWKTLFTLANPGATPARARLNFYGDDGAPLALSLSLPQSPGVAAQQASAFEQTLAPGTMLEVLADDPSSTNVQGWAQLQTDGAVTGFAAFQEQLQAGQQEAVVPLETRGASAYILPLDNLNGYFNGVALANLGAQSTTVAVTLRDAASGKVLTTDSIDLPAQHHLAFLLNDRYATITTNAAVTLELAAAPGGQIGVLGLRFNANAAFTSVPAMVMQ